MDLLTLFLITAAFALSGHFISQGTTKLAINWALKRDLLDHSNDRSSHDIPTPRVGGVGFACGMLIGLVALILVSSFPELIPQLKSLPNKENHGVDTWQALGIFGGIVAAFILGFLDDLKSLPVYIKFSGQVVIATILPLCGLYIKSIQLPGYPELITLPPLVGMFLSGAWIFLVMNAVNFMDGINGLAGKFGQYLSFFLLAAVFGWNGWEPLLILGPTLYGSLNGFLVYNSPKAQTFLGDCGSQPLGFLLAAMGLIVCTVPNEHPLPFIGILIIFSVFLFDVLFTIFCRLITGKNIFKAHREHLYQQYLIHHNENHEETRSFVEDTLLYTGITGTIYIHFFFTPQNMIPQIIGIIITIFFLWRYTTRALASSSEVNPSKS